MSNVQQQKFVFTHRMPIECILSSLLNCSSGKKIHESNSPSSRLTPFLSHEALDMWKTLDGEDYLNTVLTFR